MLKRYVRSKYLAYRKRFLYKQVILALLFVLFPALAMNSNAAKVPDGDTLPLILRDTPKPNYGAPIPKMISGRVTRLDGENTVQGIEGVSVTDGYSVVKTDAAGTYALVPNASAVFVYITRPSGYDVAGSWYKSLAAKVDFTLKAATEDENEYIFIHVTDTHLSGSPRSQKGLSDFVTELNALTPKPRFVLNSGDLISLSKALKSSVATGQTDLRTYVGIMNNLDMPHYNVAGDHTDSVYRIEDFPRGDHRCGKPLYWEYLGPNFFSFEYGKIHFMAIDSSYHLGKRQINGAEYPTLEIQPMHQAWMKEDMSMRTAGSFVVTASETDLVEQCPGFMEMAAENDVRFQLTGDIHVLSEKQRDVPYRTGGALAGCWWNPKCNQLCPDLNPQGYLIYRVVGERMEHFYKGLRQRIAILSHRVGAPWQGVVKIRAHVVQPQEGETLQWSLDGQTWNEMEERGRPFYRAVFEATVDSARLSDGLHQLQVRSAQTGETRSRNIVVVNGSTPVGLESDAVLTFSTVAQTQKKLGVRALKKPAAPFGKVRVLFNNESIGELDADAVKDYSFAIPADRVEKANTLRFQFGEAGDGMTISGPVLTVQETQHRDPRDQAIRTIKRAHWGDDAMEWGGYVVGDGGLLETPFIRKQRVFCFVLESAA